MHAEAQLLGAADDKLLETLLAYSRCPRVQVKATGQPAPATEQPRQKGRLWLP